MIENFTAQPYPLWCVRVTPEDAELGRVIGWTPVPGRSTLAAVVLIEMRPYGPEVWTPDPKAVNPLSTNLWFYDDHAEAVSERDTADADGRDEAEAERARAERAGTAAP